MTNDAHHNRHTRQTPSMVSMIAGRHKGFVMVEHTMTRGEYYASRSHEPAPDATWS